MIINPSDFIFNKEYKKIIICGDNALLIDFIIEKLKPMINIIGGYKYIQSNLSTFNDENIIVRNNDPWTKIYKYREYIYVPCYDWNIKESIKILERYNIQKEIAEYIHYSCKGIINIVNNNIEDAALLIKKRDKEKKRSPELVYKNILFSICELYPSTTSNILW